MSGEGAELPDFAAIKNANPHADEKDSARAWTMAAPYLQRSSEKATRFAFAFALMQSKRNSAEAEASFLPLRLLLLQKTKKRKIEFR